MHTSARFFAFVLLVVALAAPAFAQESHSASQPAIDAALQRHLSATANDREDVERVLANPAVRAVADQMGVDLRHAQDALGTIDAEQLARIATQARQVDQALTGGQSSVRISTTWIIIGLLVIILIIVAV